MSFTHATKVFEVSGWDTPALKLVALEMAYRADRRGVIRATQTELAEWSSLNRVTVARHVSFLENQGLIQRLGHGRYRFDLEALNELEEETAPSILQPKGAAEESDRLKTIRQPHQGIVYDNNGWPVLVDKTTFGHEEDESESEEDASS